MVMPQPALPTDPRPVRALVRGQPASDGAGVKLMRIMGTEAFPALDPFLMLDHFGSDDPNAYLAGFPDHPHRGFETVTYMLAGRMRHRDNLGNSGLLGPGSVQWMTAGRGIIHSEMPEQQEGRMDGFQLWVNLPARDKMKPPRYQDIPPDSIPVAALPGGGTVKVLAGQCAGLTGPVDGIATRPLFLDVALPADAAATLDVPLGHNGFLYVFEGQGALISGTEVPHGQLAVLGDGGHLTAHGGRTGTRFILVAAAPLNEPVARYGPFVMNTHTEIRQAVADFQSGRF